MSDMTTQERNDSDHQQEGDGHEKQMYVRFVAMVVTATVIMFGLMYVNTYAASHIRWSETRLFMALIMGGTMIIVMLGFMLSMYRNRKLNLLLVAAGIGLIALGTTLVRTQATVQARSYMSAMIPHHSIAILTSENSEIEDARVCELAVGIIRAQRREISEMEWLIEDIDRNGPATSQAEAEARRVPSFDGISLRSCP